MPPLRTTLSALVAGCLAGCASAPPAASPRLDRVAVFPFAAPESQGWAEAVDEALREALGRRGLSPLPARLPADGEAGAEEAAFRVAAADLGASAALYGEITQAGARRVLSGRWAFTREGQGAASPEDAVPTAVYVAGPEDSPQAAADSLAVRMLDVWSRSRPSAGRFDQALRDVRDGFAYRGNPNPHKSEGLADLEVLALDERLIVFRRPGEGAPTQTLAFADVTGVRRQDKASPVARFENVYVYVRSGSPSAESVELTSDPVALVGLGNAYFILAERDPARARKLADALEWLMKGEN